MRFLSTKDEICSAPCLTFASPEGINEFLNQGGNAALVEGPLLRIMNLQQPASTVTMSIYAVLLGCARLIRDFREIGSSSKFRKPNAVVQVRVEHGANDGLLSIAVRAGLSLAPAFACV